MRKWFAIMAMGVCISLPAYGQQKDKNADADAKENAASGTNSASAPAAVSKSPWALPARPRLTPFPAAADTKDTSEPGRLLPRYEISAGYSYIDFQPGDPFNNFGNQGGTGSFTYNASRIIGLTAEIGSYAYTRNLSGTQTDGGLTTYLFGPRLNLRRFDHFVPFTEFLFGGARGGGGLTGAGSKNVFSLATGGGVDVVLSKNVAWRFAQIDYLMTNFAGGNVGSSGRQNNLRLGSGLVLRFGIPNPPPPANRSPVAACSVSPASVIAGASDPVTLHVNASDPDNDTLSYSYTATGGTIEGTAADARWTASGLAAGTYTATAKVDDGKGGTATCSADLTVAPKPNQNPTISCSTDRSPIMPGERTGITSTASDPDGDPLTYSYSATAGQVSGDGPKATFDSTGLQPGSYTVKCGVSDGKGGTAESSTNVDVQQPPPPPQASKAGDCGYNKAGASRFDNACKRVGDDVALRLTNDPTAKLVIVGYADPKEPSAAKLAAARADGAKKYLGEKGIDAARISTRVGEASKEKGQEKENRRVDFVIVPEGATY
ncbi:MAG TPA: Ig-like domain-containing protein [Candidatus Sulfotelmatobacter sp.]|jgi:outer membrane protein OmpA-like peptidoglycan-associated protein|nr:Ig-like domain-containing protein [Candidatus Sulfotelmatobacter sp.]